MIFDILERISQTGERSGTDLYSQQYTVNTLSPVERAVLKHRYGLFEGGRPPLSIRKVAQEVGLPKSTAYDTEKRALAKLRPLRIR